MMRLSTTPNEYFDRICELSHSLRLYGIKRDKETGFYLESSLPDDAPSEIREACREVVAWQKKEREEDKKYTFYG